MARQRSPNRDKALEMFINARGKITNKEIAETLKEKEKTVSNWKSRDKWNVVLQSKHRSTTNKAGAPKGNSNAKGNKGNKNASAPKRNKNAVKTGEHETIYAAYLTEEEKSLFNNQIDTSIALMEEINLLRVRQLRMLKRLKQAENGLNDNEKTILYELRGRKTLIESKGKKIPVELDAELTQTEKQERITRRIDDVLRIEDALTRVSNLLTRTIKQYEDLELIDHNVRKQTEEIKLRELEARTKIIENTADKLSNNAHVNELLEALVNPKIVD